MWRAAIRGIELMRYEERKRVGDADCVTRLSGRF